MRIELDKLEKTGNQFAHRYQPEEIVLDEEQARLTEPPEVSGRVQRSGQQVRLRGKLSASAEVDCDRCLKSVAVPVETEFDVTYVPTEDYEAAEAAELQAEDLSLSVFDGETIDLDELVR
ncbi:MAG TPA: YceD family protein, partial [Pyrinomonadaceae bacterium]|nr:YceD family protein [Pyrinomonadaceae bacterium]